MTLDRQPAAAAERRPRARTISMIRPIRTMAPRRIHSQMRPVLDPLAAAAGLLAGAVRVGVAALGVTDAGAVRLGDALLAGACRWGWARHWHCGWARGRRSRSWRCCHIPPPYIRQQESLPEGQGS